MNTKQTKEGWWIIEGDTHIGKWIEDTGRLNHDDFLPELACANIPTGGVVIDAGALYGDHTIAYCRKVSTEGTVIAIEANPVAFQCLQKNAEKFQSDILLINAALGETHGDKALHCIEEGNLNAGMATVSEEDKKGVIIPTVSIDGLVKDANLTRLDFIKIDCEGYEFKILKGAKGTLKTLKPKMLIEINSFALSQQGSTDRDIYDLLLECNYCWQIVQPECTGSSMQFDILAWINPLSIQENKVIV